MIKNIKDFTLGADPEFCCVNSKGSLVKSINYTSKSAGFGRDDNQWVFEAHPMPSDNPKEVVDDIFNIFNDAANHPDFSKWKWVAGSSYKDLPFGGHIHFGILPKLISAQDACSQYLDHYVGLITLLLEDEKQAEFRRKYNLTPGGNEVHYGRASDFREKKYGFEYRTPSSWLSCPKVATAILCLAKTVMYEVINNRSGFKFNFYSTPNDFIHINLKRVRKLYPQIWRDITQMSLYKKYKKELDYINTLVGNQQSWLSTFTDMKRAWNTETKPEIVLLNKNVKKENETWLETLVNQQNKVSENLYENEGITYGISKVKAKASKLLYKPGVIKPSLKREAGYAHTKQTVDDVYDNNGFDEPINIHPQPIRYFQPYGKFLKKKN